MKTNFKKAFTLAETLIVLSIIGVLLVITAKGISRIALDKDLTKFKKTYSEIEATVSYLIQNETIYGTMSGFKDTDSVVLENIGQTLGQDKVTKFRDAFKYRMHSVEDKINCPIYNPNSDNGESNLCFRTDFGVVIGIPDTDFVSKGTVNIKDAENYNVAATPITFYTSYQQGQTVKDNAIVVFVTYDGKIFFRNIKDLECNSKSKNMQCKIEKYIYATSVKNTN